MEEAMEGPLSRERKLNHIRVSMSKCSTRGGVLLEFLASSDEVGHDIGLIRGTMLPGVIVPLHRDREPELLYVLSGSLEVFQRNYALSRQRVASI
jgi:hypothetical protein